MDEIMHGHDLSKLDLQSFCNSLIGREIGELFSSISQEIRRVRKLSKQISGDPELQHGSWAEQYCTDLQSLLCIRTNGKPSGNLNARFLKETALLVRYILSGHEYKGLRQVYSTITNPHSRLGSSEGRELILVIDRSDVEIGDISQSLAILKSLTDSTESIQRMVESVDIAFHGYDDSLMELPEIPEVRTFVGRLNVDFPYWLYFMSKRHLGLHCILSCVLPPRDLVAPPTAGFRNQLGAELLYRWIPAMNSLCRQVGATELEIMALTDRAMDYVTHGPESART